MVKKLSWLILLLPFSFWSGCAQNPITGQQELMLVPEQQDVEMGRKYAPQVEREMGGRIPDPRIQNYIDSVGQRIVRVSHTRNFDYHFVALNHDSVNALALPGGYVYVTRGMLKELKTEAQLAAILSHEVVHIVARDVSAAISREIGIEIALSAATSKKASRGVLMATDITHQIVGLKFSRRDEKDADLGGLDYMVQAGYNPNGMAEVMQMLQEQQSVRPIEFFSTHPNPENRVGYITDRIQARYYNLAGFRTGQQDYQTGVLRTLR